MKNPTKLYQDPKSEASLEAHYPKPQPHFEEITFVLVSQWSVSSEQFTLFLLRSFLSLCSVSLTSKFKN